ncbi:serine/threonine-protein kinase [Brachybacterium phenoliresistens]|nr:serine/threonine-protein kinase [Brachybacterium phenoliresistens]
MSDPAEPASRAPHRDPRLEVLAAESGYVIHERIGAGGMGIVYRGDDADGAAVAIKLLRHDISDDPRARERLAREVAAQRLVRSDAIVKILDAELDSPDAFVVTEFIPGPTLEDAVETHGGLHPEAVREIGLVLGETLQLIHGAGVIHRDLKPSNVMLRRALPEDLVSYDPDGPGLDPVIIDFGIAMAAEESRLTSTGLVMGTASYLDPQVVRTNHSGEAGDWWALAALLAFAATGRPPFGSGRAELVFLRAERGEADLEGAPTQLAAWLRRGLQADPAQRPQPDAWLEELDELDLTLYDDPGDTEVLAAGGTAALAGGAAAAAGSASAAHAAPTGVAPAADAGAGATEVLSAGQTGTRALPAQEHDPWTRGGGGQEPPGDARTEVLAAIPADSSADDPRAGDSRADDPRGDALRGGDPWAGAPRPAPSRGAEARGAEARTQALPVQGLEPRTEVIPVLAEPPTQVLPPIQDAPRTQVMPVVRAAPGEQAPPLGTGPVRAGQDPAPAPAQHYPAQHYPAQPYAGQQPVPGQQGQAGWPGQAGSPAPAPGQMPGQVPGQMPGQAALPAWMAPPPRRHLLVWTGHLILIGLAAVSPYLSLALLILLGALARTWERSHRALTLRRARGGSAPASGMAVGSASPFRFVVSVVEIVLQAVLPLGLGLLIGVAVDGAAALQGATLPDGVVFATAIGVTLLLVWVGLGSRTTRNGAHRMLDAAAPDRLWGAIVMALLLLIIAAVGATIAVRGGQVDYFPLGEWWRLDELLPWRRG